MGKFFAPHMPQEKITVTFDHLEVRCVSYELLNNNETYFRDIVFDIDYNINFVNDVEEEEFTNLLKRKIKEKVPPQRKIIGAYCCIMSVYEADMLDPIPVFNTNRYINIGRTLTENDIEEINEYLEDTNY